MRAPPPHIAITHGLRPYRAGLPPGILPAAIAMFLVGGLGPNILLAVFSMIVLIMGCFLLWRPGESPILLFTFAYPWLQATIAIFYANWLGISVVDHAPFAGDVQTATLLSLGGLLALALGMRIGSGPWRLQDGFRVREQARVQPARRWMRLYVLAWVASFSALTVASFVPGLTQLMLAFGVLKWAFYFMIAYAAFVGVPGGKQLLAVAFLVELASGIGGYFSDFRTVFFVTAFALVASGVRVTPKAIISLSLLFVLAIIFAVVWTAVKRDFRSFVSGGAAAQIVTVDYVPRVSKLAELVGELDAEKMGLAADDFLRRLTYVEFFSVVLERVPAQLPHEGGAILWDAALRPFMPRLFFPDKAIIDDSVRTKYYTGLNVSGSESGSSISIGWIGEAYIDFGSFGMFLALLVIGVFYGGIYRGFQRWSATHGLLGMALATAVLTGTGALENSFTKVFGGVIVSLLVAWAVVKFALPILAPWLMTARPR